MVIVLGTCPSLVHLWDLSKKEKRVVFLQEGDDGALEKRRCLDLA